MLNEITIGDFNKILNSKEIRIYEEESLSKLYEYNKNDLAKNKKYLEEKILDNYKRIQKYLRKILFIHKKYKNMFDFIKEENTLHASYLIFAKVISYLIFMNKSLLDKYLTVLPYFRLINEAIILAEYFSISDKTNDINGKNALKKWYREEKTPDASVMRNSISNYSKQYLSDELNNAFSKTLFNSHHLQSKVIHNSYNNIRNIFSGNNSTRSEVIIEYNTSNNLREIINYQVYLQQNLLTLTNGFLMCFNNLDNFLLVEDVRYLNNLRDKLLNSTLLREMKASLQ